MAGQDEAFRAAVLGNAEGGFAPEFAPAAPIGVSPEEQAARAERFRQAVTGAVPGARALAPYGDGIKLGLDAVGALNNPIGAVSALANHPDVARRGGEVAIGLPRPREGVTTRTHDADPADIKPMNTPLANVQAAPTLAGTAPARPMGGGGVGGIGFGGLEKNLRDAQGRQLHSLDDAAGLEQRLGTDRALATMTLSDMKEADALARQRDAEEQMRIEADAQQRHRAFLVQQEKLADEIGKQGVDPGRYLRNADLGMQVTFGLGSALGEMFSSDGRNHFLDRVDKYIAQDVEAQVAGNDAKRESYKARASLFDKMLAESGDRRLAGMQTQKMLYDAIDKKLVADAARLGVPEIMTGAEIKAQEYRQKSADLGAQIAAQALQQARAAAAAAAASQRAAEERAWQHQKDLIDLEIKRYGAETDRIKAGKEGGEGAKADAAALGEATKRLADDDVVKNRALIRSLAGKIRPDGTVVGLDATATAKRGLAGAIPGVNFIPGAVDRIGLNDDERIARQEYEQLALLFRHATTGSGGSEKELEGIRKAFEGAGSAAEKIKVIRMAEAELNRREKLATTSLTDAQKAELERRQARDGIADPTPKTSKSAPTEEPVNPWLRKDR